MKNLTYKKYITKETAEVSLFYDRNTLKYGETIKGYERNTNLYEGLVQAEEVVFSMYWKPLGDSLLFLSVIQAVDEFLKVRRAENMPKYILDEKFSGLLTHIDILRESIVVKSGIDYFKEMHLNGKKVALITDDEQIDLESNPVIFNSENYLYPKFIDNKTEYKSRPARYFLTFEREIGVRLNTNPNGSLPLIKMKFSKQIEDQIFKKYNIKLSNNSKTKFISIISQAGEIEKRYGTLKFMKLLSKIKEKYNDTHCFLVANWKEESPKEWYKLKKILTKNKFVTLLETKDFEELSYIFSRCEFIVGNDTGFSHLAAMSLNVEEDKLPKVFILYSRHDYEKWSTGKDNVFPISTKLSEYLTKHNMSLRRDEISEKLKGKNEWAFSIRISTIFNSITKNLNEA